MKTKLEKRIKYLQSKLPKDVDLEKKYEKDFAKQASYMGNGIYSFAGAYASDTREVFLMGILGIEGIEYKN